MSTFVALDLETTGLDPERDTIIEIGAVKFRADRVQSEYQTLVNPERGIPIFIQHLTGISDAMVSKAPVLHKALPALIDFVGDAVIVGHNIRFDLSFLHKQRLFKDHDLLDTYDLAAVLMPAAGRYTLGALAQANGILLPATHRALEDARVSHALFRKLFERALSLPLEVLAEIVSIGQEVSWGGDLFFEHALRARSTEAVSGPETRGRVSGPLFADKPEPAARPLRPGETRQPLDVEALAALLSPGGAFEQRFASFEHRPQQVQMLRAVAEALNKGQHLLVEAGTGTGKSVAYLLPAVHWALQNNERVVVSTNTINLQDQLINKDIPALREVLGQEFRTALLKGRANYVCPRRLEAIRRRGPRHADEVRLLAKLLVWLPASPSGDVSEITLSGAGERGAWGRISAQDEGCTAERCSTQMGGICPFYRARRAAEAAHLVVVNHALLLADVASGSKVLPEYQYLIVDEGHHLEAATTDGLTFEASQSTLERSLKELGGPSAGLLGQVLKACRDAVPPEVFPRIEAHVDQTYNAVSTVLLHTSDFFQVLGEFCRAQRGGRGDRMEYAQQLRIVPAVRTQSGWDEVEIAWGNLDAVLRPAVDLLDELAVGLNDLADYDVDDGEELMWALKASARELDEFATQTNALVSRAEADRIYWVELGADGERLSLHVAPLTVGPLIEKHLWFSKESVVLTSATLTTAKTFDYLKGRLNADSAEALAVGSPFNYEDSTLLYVVNDIPEPGDRAGHQRALEAGLIKLCAATRGRAMVLFTSHAQMRQTAQAIRGPLERSGVVVYDQTEGTSRHQLLESFRHAGQAVLLGTRSFWEGVDVVGEALSVLVIAKLPFDVPTDPIIAARAETFENPFADYNLPEAILRFRQGFGRLIRSRQDRGVVAVFDRRVLSKSYGRLFVDSLPRCTRREGPLINLPVLAAKWIDGTEP